MAARHESPIAAMLADAQQAFAGTGEFAALPDSARVGEVLGLTKHVVQKTAAWKAYAAWQRSLRALCEVCGRRAHTTDVRMCHTHRERWRRWGSPQPWLNWAVACREQRLNTCNRCGRQFNGAQGRIRHCRDCDLDRRREQALKRWHDKTDAEKQEAIDRAKVLGRRRRRRRIKTLRCAICDREFRGFPHRVFCGKRCRQEAANRQRREIRRRVKLLELLREQHNLWERLNGHDSD